MPKPASTAFKAKKKSLEKAAWMNQQPNPIPVFRKGEIVEVYRGAGWSKAKVLISTPKGCTVQILQGAISTNIYDARCIRPTANNSDE